MNFDFEQKHIIAAAGLFMVVGAFALSYDSLETSEEVDVVATFYPFYEISGQVAGEEASVDSLVPPGTDPHSFEPSPGDIERLNQADIFVATGAEFEEWEQDVVDSLDSDVRVVYASKEIELIDMDESDHGHEHHEDEHHEDEHDEHHEDEHHEDEHDEHHEGHHDEHHEDEHHDDHHDHSHGRYDPHYWLSPGNAEVIAEEVAEALRDEYPESSEAFDENLDEFSSELEDLDSEYSERLEGCEKDRILITHAAFSYMGEDYGFEQVPVTGLSHLTEPSPQELEDLQDQAEEHGLEHVFYDSMMDSSVAETIADGVDAEVLVLHSLEGANEEPYVDLMGENLENLETALQCR